MTNLKQSIMETFDFYGLTLQAWLDIKNKGFLNGVYTMAKIALS